MDIEDANQSSDAEGDFVAAFFLKACAARLISSLSNRTRYGKQSLETIKALSQGVDPIMEKYTHRIALSQHIRYTLDKRII